MVALPDDRAAVVEVLPDGEDALRVEDDRESADVDRARAVDVLVRDDVGCVGKGSRSERGGDQDGDEESQGVLLSREGSYVKSL